MDLSLSSSTLISFIKRKLFIMSESSIKVPFLLQLVMC